MPKWSYNVTMDTIIYLKMRKRLQRSEQLREPEVFHIRQCKGQWGISEGRQLLFVTIPWNADLQYRCWPEELAAYLQPFFGYSASIETVADRSVTDWIEEKKLKEQWVQSWCYPHYRDYHRIEYAAYLVERAMKYLVARYQATQYQATQYQATQYRSAQYQAAQYSSAKYPDAAAKEQGMQQVHMYVLGYESFVPEVIATFLMKIKTLTFLLPQSLWEECGLEDYREILCEEEGLATGLQMLEEPRAYKGLRLKCLTPALVLDLSGEEKVQPDGSGRDVFWIDMDSQEAKRRKIASGSAETAYFSMKEEWRRLDTVGKNGYNT